MTERVSTKTRPKTTFMVPTELVCRNMDTQMFLSPLDTNITPQEMILKCKKKCSFNYFISPFSPAGCTAPSFQFQRDVVLHEALAAPSQWESLSRGPLFKTQSLLLADWSHGWHTSGNVINKPDSVGGWGGFCSPFILFNLDLTVWLFVINKESLKKLKTCRETLAH